jgi:hypothetical protein
MASEAHVASEWGSHHGRVAPQYKQAKENAEQKKMQNSRTTL